MNKGKIITLTILMPLLVLAALITSLFLLGNLLGYILSSNETYLLTGLAFHIIVCIIIILIPIILFLSCYKKKEDRQSKIINSFQKQKAIYISFILIIVIIESIFGFRGYLYYKDIAIGPQKDIMTNAFIKVRHRRGGTHTYIIGDIDGQKIQMNITRDARSKVSRNETYKMIRIEYYKNIKEVFDVEKILY